jgi:hypothetical protein
VAEQLAGIREERIFELCDRLSPGKKAQLVKHLLGDQSLQVVFGNSQLHVGTMHQINLSDKDKMAMLLRVIADKILK